MELQINKNKKKKINIICPYCRKYNLTLTRNLTNSNGQYIYVCHICNYFFPENWFDEFKQFEHLVTRQN